MFITDDSRIPWQNPEEVYAYLLRRPDEINWLIAAANIIRQPGTFTVFARHPVLIQALAVNKGATADDLTKEIARMVNMNSKMYIL